MKIQNLPMTYRNNAKAWMLTVYFQEWFQDFKLQVTKKHGEQPILLLLDNCLSHKIENLNLDHIEIYFFPPETTSRIQLMDAGVIMAFKRHYHHLHLW